MAVVTLAVTTTIARLVLVALTVTVMTAAAGTLVTVVV
jgi:hypothetical protein